MRAVGVVLAAVLCLALSLLPAHAEKRVALVIGNSAYRSVAGLPNARSDAQAIAKLFTDAKFDVVEAKSDLGVDDFRRALRDFAAVAGDADVAVVYYAGHGIEVAGTNYLIPVDAKLATDFDVEDETVSLDRVMRAMEPARRLKLVLLDACRENPFLPKMSRLSPTRDIERGLARVEVDSSNTMVAFAAKAGATAADGDGSRNSPFARALLANLMTPGLDIRLALGKVHDQVLRETNRRQEPAVYASLGGDIVALVPQIAVATATSPSSRVPISPEPNKPNGGTGAASPAPQTGQVASATTAAGARALAPPKAYKPVTIKLPVATADPSFVAFRKELTDVAQKKDRAALAKLVLPSFFLINGDKDTADKKKPGIDNLAKALSLDGKDGAAGWATLVEYGKEPTTEQDPDHKGVLCAPADPTFDENAAEALAKDTQTDPGEWGYPIKDGVEVLGAGKAGAQVIDKLGLYLVRVYLDDSPGAAVQGTDFIRLVLPSGKLGYVSSEQLLSLGNEQLCYAKEGGGWKIAGFIGQ